MGTIPVAVKFVQADAVSIGIVRLAVAAPLVYLMFARRSPLRGLGWREWLALASIGIAFGIHWLLYFLSIKIGTPALAVTGLASYGLWLLLLGAVLQKTPLRLSDIAAVGLGLAGALWIAPSFDLANDGTRGLLIGVVSGFFFALLPVLHQRWNAKLGLGNDARSIAQFGFGLLFFLCFWPAAEFTSFRSIDWLGLAYLAVICTALAHTLWVRATTALHPAASGVFYYGTLPVAMFCSAIVLGETITWSKAGGAALVAAGSLLGVLNQKRASDS